MHHKCDQYGEEWVRLRIGRPTASQFHHIVTPSGAPTKGKERNKYKYRLVAERLLGQVMDDKIETQWMKRGSLFESDALKAFVAARKFTVKPAGFFTTMDNKVGASPDGIIVYPLSSVHEGLEIKVPAPYTHVGYLCEGMGDDYKAQVQGQMWVCGFKRMHFWSYHPSMPSIYRVIERDENYVAKLFTAVISFCQELDLAEDHCRGLGTFKLAEKLRLSEEMSVGEIMDGL